MNVGDYVRTKDGIILKIKDIEDIYTTDNIYIGMSIYDNEGHFVNDVEIIKSSPNIIDLIEVGDYVNGWRVNRVEREEDGTLLTVGTLTSFVSKNEKEPYLTQDYNEADKICKIKSIVTKECFEHMEYKVGDEEWKNK